MIPDRPVWPPGLRGGTAASRASRAPQRLHVAPLRPHDPPGPQPDPKAGGAGGEEGSGRGDQRGARPRHPPPPPPPPPATGRPPPPGSPGPRGGSGARTPRQGGLQAGGGPSWGPERLHLGSQAMTRRALSSQAPGFPFCKGVRGRHILLQRMEAGGYLSPGQGPGGSGSRSRGLRLWGCLAASRHLHLQLHSGVG